MPDKSPFPLTPPPQDAAQHEAAQHKQNESILRRMDSADYATRKEAMEECRRLPVQRIVGLIYGLEAKTQRKSVFWQRNVIVGVSSGIGILLGFAALAGVDVFILLAALSFVLFFACAIVESVPVKTYSSRAVDSLAQLIENIRDPAFLPIALRILYTQYQSTEYDSLDRLPKALECASAYLLRKLNIEEVQALVGEEKLYWFLKPSCWRQNPYTSVRVLNILEVIGTPAAIPDVRIIAGVIMPSLGSATVKAAAQSCLVAIKEREKESKLPRTLLRAAAAPAPAADTLLRPAAGSADDAPAQLLRAAAPTADE